MLQVAEIASDPFDFGFLAGLLALLGDPLDRLVPLILFPVDQDDLGTVEGEEFCDFLANPFGTASDEGSSARQVGLLWTRWADDRVESLLHCC